MFEIGDTVFYEGKNYVILWIYTNGNCELIDRNLSVANNILVHIDKLKQGKQDF